MSARDGGMAFPFYFTPKCDMVGFEGEEVRAEETSVYGGMTFRQWLVGQALAGSACCDSTEESRDALAFNAIAIADAAIAKLNEEPNP